MKTPADAKKLIDFAYKLMEPYHDEGVDFFSIECLKIFLLKSEMHK